VRCGVELRLVGFVEALNVRWVEHMVPREVLPEGHAANGRLGRLDRLQPDVKLVGLQAPQPFARRTTVAGAPLLGGVVTAFASASV
jgi:hypothetical protein